MKPDIAQWLRHIAAVCSALSILALGGCARSDGPPEPSEGQATIGAAGGTVQGPDGVTVVVPQDALASDTTIRVARDAGGAPQVGGLRLLTPIYQVTPHGAEFEAPVRIRIPFDRTQQRAATAPVIIRAQAGSNQWEMLPTEVQDGVAAADSFGFSYYAVGECFVSGDIGVPGPGPIAHCPTDFSLSLTLYDGSGTLLPQPRSAAGTLLPALTIDTPTQLAIRVRYYRPDTNVVDTIELRSTGRQPAILQQTRAVGVGIQDYQFDVAGSAVTIDPAQIYDASRPGGKNLRIWATVTRTFDAFYPGCLCWRPTSWTFVAEVMVKVIYRGVQPTIAQQPINRAVTAGQTATFTVAATAPSPVSYQWQRAAAGATAFVDIAGATQSSHTTPPAALADDGSRYRARVCTRGGTPPVDTCVYSNEATLSVSPAVTAPVFTQQPQSMSVVEGQTASFTATATGTPTPTVRWYRELAGGPVQVGPTCSGSGGTTACTYTTPAVTAADNGARFYALADNGQQARSDTATLTVTPAATPPAIPANEPADVTVTAGQSATFSVSATGTAPLSYQWQRDGADIAGANGASYTLNNAQMSDNGARFRVVVSNGAGSAMSREATLTVTAPSACSAPQLIESGAGQAALPEIAMDANGNAVAVWQQNDGTFLSIYANRYTSGSGWGSAQLIESMTGDTYQPRIAMDSGGNAIAVWSSQYDRIHANRYVAGGGWGTVQLLDNGSGNPDIVMDPSGDAIAVWQRFDGSTDSIYASRYSSGSSWSAPHLIENGAGSANNARIAVDGNGNAIAVWSQSNGTSYNLTANRYTQGTGWGTAQPIETLSREADASDIAMNASGDAVVVWRDRINNGDSVVDAPVYAIRYTPGSGWGTAQRLDSGTNYGYVLDVPQVAIDASGNAIAVWHDYDGAGQRIYARRYIAGSGWGALEQLQSPTGNDAWRPDVAMDANGNAIVVWLQSHMTTFGIFFNRYAPGSGWGGATLLANATIDVHQLRVALNGGGTATAVWQEGDGTTYNIKAVRCP